MNPRFTIPPISANSGTWGRTLICLTVYAVLGGAILLPLFWAKVPPLVDYPNHLARMWILVHGAEIPELAGNYAVHWRILPNLAMDLVVPALSRVMPVEEAGRGFIALTMLALVGGTVILHRVLYGRLEIWPIWSVLFVYNAALFWGFLNFLFATGIFLLAFSGWVASRAWRPGPRIMTFSAVASLLLLLHLVAFGLYGLSVLSYELGNRVSGCRLTLRSFVSWSAVCLQFLPSFLLWYASLAHGGPTFTAYGDLAAKFYALMSPFTFGYEPAVFDPLFGLLACSLLIVAIATRSFKLVPEMRLPLVAVIIAAVIMPNWASGSWSADIRLPIALPFIIIASTRLEVSRKGAVVAIAAAASIVLGLRLWTVSQAWRDYDRLFAEFRMASAVIAKGARVLVVEAPIPEQKRRLSRLPTGFAKRQSAPFMHMAALAVIDRAAFFPYLFTGWYTIDATQRNEAVAQAVAVPMTPGELTKSADPEQAKTLDTGPNFLGERPYWRDWPERFDFVLWIDFGGARKPELEQLQPLTSGSFFNIYRVIRH
jgi:hypothetical protein